MSQKPPFGTRITLLLASSLTVMSGALIAPALPQMATAFGGDAEAEFLVKTILTIPAIVIAVFSPFAGWIIDRFGKMRILFISLVLYGLAGSAGLYLNTPLAFLASRAFFGIFVAIVMTTATTLIGDYFEGEARNSFLGLQGAFMALGGTVLVALSGLLADINWRFPFAVYLFSLVVLVLSIKYLWESNPKSEEANASLGTQGSMPYFSIITIYLTTFVGMVLFYLIPTQSPFLLKSLGVTQSSLGGVGIIVSTLFAAIMARSYPLLKKRSSYAGLYILCFVLMGSGFVLVFLTSSFVGAIVGFMLSGLGAGIFFPNASLCLMAIAPPTLRGRVIGGLVSAAFLGQFASPILIQPLLDATSLLEIHLWLGLLSIGIGLLFFRVRLQTSPKVATASS